MKDSLNNAKERLKSVSIENNIYTDIKRVREAFGVAYLAVLEAINEALLNLTLSHYTGDKPPTLHEHIVV